MAEMVRWSDGQMVKQCQAMSNMPGLRRKGIQPGLVQCSTTIHLMKAISKTDNLLLLPDLLISPTAVFLKAPEPQVACVVLSR